MCALLVWRELEQKYRGLIVMYSVELHLKALSVSTFVSSMYFESKTTQRQSDPGAEDRIIVVSIDNGPKLVGAIGQPILPCMISLNIVVIVVFRINALSRF